MIKMGDEIVKSEEEVSKMFADSKETFSPDEELALDIMHRFNIDRDTLDTMPAFEEHLRSLFLGREEK